MNRAFLFLMLCFFSQIIAFGQNNFDIREWEGEWEGTIIYPVSETKMDTVNMNLIIAATNKEGIYDWTIVYTTKDTIDIRAYQIIASEENNGHFTMDEKNSIYLDDLYRNNGFYSVFEVNKTRITSINKMIGGKIYVIMIITNAEKYNESGGEKDIPIVYSYPIVNIQECVLTKKK